VLDMIDREADRALHRQLADLLREQINSGALEPGAALPSETYLGQTHGLSRTAVRRALELLLNEGLIVKERARRTTVRERPQRGIVVLEPGDRIEARMPTETERRLLSVPVGEPVLEVRRADGAVELLAGASTTLQVP
jgi:DNA-binding GntR family transcriptional regulator